MNEKKKVKLSVAILFYLTLFLVSFVFLSVFSYYTSRYDKGISSIPGFF